MKDKKNREKERLKQKCTELPRTNHLPFPASMGYFVFFFSKIQKFLFEMLDFNVHPRLTFQSNFLPYYVFDQIQNQYGLHINPNRGF